jgi:hypothetical protein
MTFVGPSARRLPVHKNNGAGEMMLDNNNSDGNGEMNKECRVHSPAIDAMMREVRHTLGNLDFQHDADVERLERSSTDELLKNYIRGKLLARHRERRELYVELLTDLRKRQHRLARAA